MIWQNLTKLPPTCPLCDEELEHVEKELVWECLSCDFSISSLKFKEIVSNLVDDDVFTGSCEECGKKINPRYRICRQCENQ